MHLVSAFPRVSANGAAYEQRHACHFFRDARIGKGILALLRCKPIGCKLGSF